MKLQSPAEPEELFMTPKEVARRYKVTTIGAPDITKGGNKLHHFAEVLFMAVSAMLCCMNSFSDIKDFCDWLCEWIKMPNGVPRAHTFSNIFSIIEPDLFNHCLPEHIGALYPILKRQIIAIDGMRLRGSRGLDPEACR